MSRKGWALMLMVTLVVPLGCARQERSLRGEEQAALVGGAIGAGLGALIGEQTGEAGAGTAVGAAAGGITGYLIGRGYNKYNPETGHIYPQNYTYDPRTGAPLKEVQPIRPAGDASAPK